MLKNLPANAGDAGGIPGSGRSPGGGYGNPLQYCCPENPKDRGGYSPWGCKIFRHDLMTERTKHNRGLG